MKAIEIAGPSLLCVTLGLGAVTGGCAQTEGGNNTTGAGGNTGGTGSGTGGRGGTGTGGSGTATGGTGSGSGGTGMSGTGGTGTGGTGMSGTGGTGMSGTGGTGGTGTVPPAMARLFPAHASYAPGVKKPTIAQAEMDTAVRNFYTNTWKKNHVKPACDGWYVHTGGGTGVPEGVSAITISEGHGYGMMAVAYMAGADPQAKTIFDGMHTFWKKFPSINQNGLMAWVILASCTLPNEVTGDMTPDSATDGDLDMAYAYLLAHHQWGSAGAINYFEEARKIIAAIRRHEINAETNLIMLGDWADIKAPYYAARYAMGGHTGPYERGSHAEFYYGTRPSDFMLDHFRAFGAVTGDAAWTGAILNSHYDLINRLQTMYSPQTGLLPDFVEGTKTGAKPAQARYLEWEDDGNFAPNACRVPWRLGTEYAVAGDARMKTALQKMNSWIKMATGKNPVMIKNGYRLDGTPLVNYGSYLFSAPFGVAAMADDSADGQAWLDALWRHVANDNGEGYYPDSIKLFSMLVMSGNWWKPY